MGGTSRKTLYRELAGDRVLKEALAAGRKMQVIVGEASTAAVTDTASADEDVEGEVV